LNGSGGDDFFLAKKQVDFSQQTMYSWASTPNSGEFSNKHWHFTQQSMGNMWAVMNLGWMLVELSLGHFKPDALQFM